MDFQIAVLGGDGIGPSVVDQAVKVLRMVERHSPHTFRLEHRLIAGAALSATGQGLPEETLAVCRSSDAVLLGAVGDDHWDAKMPPGEGATASLLRLRRGMGLWANLRPVRVSRSLFELAQLKDRALGDGVDLLILRELSGGLLYGRPRGRRMEDGVEEAFDTMQFSRPQVERIAHLAMDLARRRRSKVTSADQANVLESNRLWRETMTAVAKEYPDVIVEHLFIDNCANELSRKPYEFDVIVTEGVFGGILSDQVAAVAGSIGMLPSATVGDGRGGIFEPVHGSAPKYAGQDKANPIGTIRSLALLLDLALGLSRESSLIETAVGNVIARGVRTYDIAAAGCTMVGTEAMGDAVAGEAAALLAQESVR